MAEERQGRQRRVPESPEAFSLEKCIKLDCFVRPRKRVFHGLGTLVQKLGKSWAEQGLSSSLSVLDGVRCKGSSNPVVLKFVLRKTSLPSFGYKILGIVFRNSD